MRKKSALSDKSMPSEVYPRHAIRYCLETAGIGPQELAGIATNWNLAAYGDGEMAAFFEQMARDWDLGSRHQGLAALHAVELHPGGRLPPPSAGMVSSLRRGTPAAGGGAAPSLHPRAAGLPPVALRRGRLPDPGRFGRSALQRGLALPRRRDPALAGNLHAPLPGLVLCRLHRVSGLRGL